MKYITRDREAGNVIDTFDSLEEALKAIESYEAEDMAEGTFTKDFYEAVEAPNVFVVFDERLNRSGDPIDTYCYECESLKAAQDKADDIKWYLTAGEKKHLHIYIGEMPAGWNDEDLIAPLDPVNSWEVYGTENVRRP